MRVKIILLVVFSMLVAAVATSRSVFLQGRTQQLTKKWEDPTTLQARVKKVKAKGFQKVTLPAPHMEYAEKY